MEKQLGISHGFWFLSVFYRDRVIRINLHNVSDTNCEVNDFICYFLRFVRFDLYDPMGIGFRLFYFFAIKSSESFVVFFFQKKELVTNSNLVDLGQGFSEAVGSACIH